MAKAASKSMGRDISTKELSKLMEQGQVDSKVLVEFGKVLQEQARQGGQLEAALKTTSAQQGRFNNAFSDFIKKLSESGFDDGMATLFDSMRVALESSGPLIEKFGEIFRNVADDIQDIVYFLSGKESTLEEYRPLLDMAKRIGEAASSVISMETAFKGIAAIITARAFMAALSLMAIIASPAALISGAAAGGIYLGSKIAETDERLRRQNQRIELPDNFAERLAAAKAREASQQINITEKYSNPATSTRVEVKAPVQVTVQTNNPVEFQEYFDKFFSDHLSRAAIEVPYRAGYGGG